MPDTSPQHGQHAALLDLARSVPPPSAVTQDACEQALGRLIQFSERLAAHLAAEHATVDAYCAIAGAGAVACAMRQREVDALTEAVAGMRRRWGSGSAIALDPGQFTASWEIVVAALGRLQAREEGEIYPFTGAIAAGPPVTLVATGLPGIDRDHDGFFATIADLRAALGNGQQRADAQVIADLARYAERHFADEEAIMEATNFAGLDDHRLEHHLARTILLGFRNDHLDGRPVEAAAVLAFLERWWATHIAHADMAMARHALAAGWQP